ncbi:MAG: N-acetylmuramoyl-L-alanine amidase [Mogibacterium sp.]|nr:N-acetylmuramoyl-L-alanine amidase [Mogibacterium sp.]
MQLTDAEIRQILIREKRRKRRRQQMRRRRTVLVILLLIIAVIVAVRYAGSKETPPAAEPSRGVVFIDPGHGGEDPGSDNGARYEKDDTLKLALAVRDQLEKANFTVVMSRTEDVAVERAARGQMANENGAKLMVSIHRNKADGAGQGVEAFIPVANTPESQLLAGNIVRSLAAQGFTERTVRAGTLQSELENYEELAVATMPCCIVEVGFLDNVDDNALFDNNLEANAKAICEAIDQAFISLYEPEKLQTEEEAQTEEAPAEAPAEG